MAPLVHHHTRLRSAPRPRTLLPDRRPDTTLGGLALCAPRGHDLAVRISWICARRNLRRLMNDRQIRAIFIPRTRTKEQMEEVSHTPIMDGHTSTNNFTEPKSTAAKSMR